MAQRSPVPAASFCDATASTLLFGQAHHGSFSLSAMGTGHSFFTCQHCHGRQRVLSRSVCARVLHRRNRRCLSLRHCVSFHMHSISLSVRSCHKVKLCACLWVF